MLSLMEQLSYQARVQPTKTLSRAEIRASKPHGYAARTVALEARTMARYIAALSKRKWSTSRELMLDLGLKDQVCVTKTMSNEYMKNITRRRNTTVGPKAFMWSLKPGYES